MLYRIYKLEPKAIGCMSDTTQTQILYLCKVFVIRMDVKFVENPRDRNDFR